VLHAAALLEGAANAQLNLRHFTGLYRISSHRVGSYRIYNPLERGAGAWNVGDEDKEVEIGEEAEEDEGTHQLECC